MKSKKFIAIAGILSLAIMSLSLAAIGATEAGVTATVTPQVVSITVTDGTVDYGVLDTSETANTVTLTQTQTITNGSNVSANVSLRSSDAYVISDTTDWALAGATGSNAYVHSYDIDAPGTPVWTALPFDGTFNNTYTGSVVTLTESTGLDPSATLDLKIDMPTSISNTAAHSVNVTALATAI